MAATENNTGKQHALLSASSSHRWLNCTPSAREEEKYEDEDSDFAREGTLAHALGAKNLKYRLGLDYKDEEKEIAELRDEFMTGEMIEYAEGYANYVMERYQEAFRRAKADGTAMPEIMVEARLDFSDWVPDGFGTGDAVIIGGGMVEVIDLKYGKGVEVSAERNTQMMLYALGAGVLMDYAYDIRTVRMTIYQPRRGNLSEWEMPLSDLMVWAEDTLRPLAQVAERGLGAPQCGSWCKFCKAKGNCACYAQFALETFRLHGDPVEISPEYLPSILERIPLIKDWAAAVEERGLKLALQGEKIKGFKLVEGRSVRKITDPEGAAAALMAAGGDEKDIWRPRELRTLTDLERTFGKKGFAKACGGYIEKPAGKPTLVPESDKRKALNPVDDFAGFDLG